MSIGQVAAWKQAMLQHWPFTVEEIAHFKGPLQLATKCSVREKEIQKIHIAWLNLFNSKYWIVCKNPSFERLAPFELCSLLQRVRVIKNYEARELFYTEFKRCAVFFSHWLCDTVTALIQKHSEKLALCKELFASQFFPSVQMWIQESFEKIKELDEVKTPVITVLDIKMVARDLIVLIFESVESANCSPYINLENLQIIKDKLPEICATYNSPDPQNSKSGFPEICEDLENDAIGIDRSEIMNSFNFLRNLKSVVENDLSIPKKYDHESVGNFMEFVDVINRSFLMNSPQPNLETFRRLKVTEALEFIRSKNLVEKDVYKRVAIPSSIVKKLNALGSS